MSNPVSTTVVPFFRIKYEVEEHLKASGLSYTILRPTAFMESHAHALSGEPILTKGKAVLFGRGERPRNFVAADDVARLAVQAVRDPSLAGQTIDVGGPEDPSNVDVVRLYERASGREAEVIHVPLGVLRAASWLVRPLHPGLSQVIQAGVLADTTDQRFDAQPFEEGLGMGLTRLEEWASGRASPSA